MLNFSSILTTQETEKLKTRAPKLAEAIQNAANQQIRWNELIPFMTILLSENVSKTNCIIIGVPSYGGGSPAERITLRITSSSTRLPVARQLTTIKILLSIKYFFLKGGMNMDRRTKMIDFMLINHSFDSNKIQNSEFRIRPEREYHFGHLSCSLPPTHF